MPTRIRLRHAGALVLALGLACGAAVRAGSIPLVVLKPNQNTSPGEKSTALDDGDKCLFSGDLDGAITNFNRAIQDDPKSVVAYAMRACAYQNKGDNDDAIADTTRALELDPKYANMYLMRGILYDRKGDHAKAIADETEALRLNPANLQPCYERGCAYVNSGDYDRAIADFDRCLAKPDATANANARIEDTSSTYGLAMLDMGGWRPNRFRGIAYLRKGDFAKAEDDFTLSILQDPKDAVDYLNRGTSRIREGHDEAAFADLDRALELDPGNADIHNERGGLYYREHNSAAAEQDFLAALKIDPRHAKAYSNLGLVYMQTGDVDKAIEACTQALQIDPRLLSAYCNRAQAFAAKGEEDQVIADYSQALAIAPDNPEILSNLALAFTKLGDYGRAVEGLEHALALDPGLENASNNLAWLLATCPDAKFRDGKRALAAATLACKLTSWKDPISLDTFAAACAESGDFTAAVKWEQSALAQPGLAPGDVADAKKRLALYQAHKTYQEDPRAPAASNANPPGVP